MKNKKNLLIILITCLVVVTGCGKKTASSEPAKPDIKLASHEIANIKKSEVKIPNFNIRMDGIVNMALSRDDLNYNEIYPTEFDAGIETPWGTETDHYVGYSIKSLLSVLKRTDYKSIVATNAFGTKVTYPLDVVNSGKLFLVFYKNGEEISNGKMAIISIDENEKYFVSNVVKLTASDVEAK